MNIGKFVLNVVIAFIAYGALYQGGTMMIPDQMAATQAAMNPQEETMMTILAYHLAQTVAVVWLFGKAVGSGDLKAGAIFGLVIGFYLMATQAIWFTAVKDLPQDPRMVLAIMDLVVGALVGTLLAFLHGKGLGFAAADAEPEAVAAE